MALVFRTHNPNGGKIMVNPTQKEKNPKQKEGWREDPRPQQEREREREGEKNRPKEQK